MKKSYADIDYADTYFALRAFSEVWTAAEDSVKVRFLSTASVFIRDYCTFIEEETGKPYTYDEAGENEEWLKRATCEEALYLLALGKDPTAADKKTTLGIKSADGVTFDKSFSADILCISCRKILEDNGGVVSIAAYNGGSVSEGFVVK